MNKQKNIVNQCLSLKALVGFQDKLLSKKDLQLASEHMSECEFCSDLGKSLNSQDLPIINSIAANVNSRISSMTGYVAVEQHYITIRNVLLILLAFLSIITLYYFLLNNQENKTIFLSPVISNNNDSKSSVKLSVNGSKAIEQKVVKIKKNIHESKVVNSQPKEMAIEQSTKIVEVKTTSIENQAVVNIPIKEAVKNEIFIQNNNSTINQITIKRKNQQLIISVEMISKMSDVKVDNTRRGSLKNGDIGSARTSKTEGFYLPDEMPEFYGGDEGLKEYVKDKISALLKENAELRQKTITVEFLVTAKGKIEEPSIAKGVSTEIDEMVLKEIKKMPNWKPAAKRKGDIRCLLAISFD